VIQRLHVDTARLTQGAIVLSHTGGTGYSMTMLQRAREANAETVFISGIGNGGGIETVAAEQSYAYTASHTAAMLVLAQIATRLGAQLGPLDAIPERVPAVLDLPGPLIDPPARLVELIGAGPNGWTAQEGALKIREERTEAIAAAIEVRARRSRAPRSGSWAKHCQYFRSPSSYSGSRSSWPRPAA
jgi:fructoselysine-6-P-deglycase FrlB-like protein